jgi:uncharacterized protein (TIGR03545 family)
LIKKTGENVQKDFNFLQTSIQSVQDLVKQDKADIEKSLQLPKLDATSITMALLGPAWQARIAKGKQYYSLAQKYIPPPKSKEERAEWKPQPEARLTGVNIRFPKLGGYPVVWLQLARISTSELKGELRNATSDPEVIMKPMVLTAEGNLVDEQIRGIKLKFLMDNTTQETLIQLAGDVAQFPVGGNQLITSPNLNLSFEQATGSSQFNATVKSGQLDLTSRTKLNDPKYKLESNTPILKDLVQAALDELKTVSIDATARGEMLAPRLEIQSNIGSAFETAFKKQLNAKIEEAKKKIQEMIDSQIKPEKEKLEKVWTDIKSQAENQLKNKDAEINKLKGLADQKVQEAKNSAVKQIEVPSNLNDLKKKFGF